MKGTDEVFVGADELVVDDVVVELKVADKVADISPMIMSAGVTLPSLIPRAFW